MRFSIQQLEVRDFTAQFVNDSFLADSSDNLADDMDDLYSVFHIVIRMP